MKDPCKRSLLEKHADFFFGNGRISALLDSKQREHGVGRRAEQPDERRNNAREGRHRPGDKRCNRFRAVERDSFRDQFTDHERYVRDDQHHKRERERIRNRFEKWHLGQEIADRTRKAAASERAQHDADHCTTAAEQPPDDAPAAPFSVKVDAVEVAEVTIQFEDLDQARPLHVGLGELSLGFALQAQRQGEGVELQLGDLKAELKQLSLTQADAPEALLTLDRTVLQGGTVDLAGTRLALDELQVQGGRVIVERDARGGLNWQRVWTSQGTEADAAAANPWQLSLQRFSLADFGAVATDHGASTPVTLNLVPIGLQLGAFTSPPQGPMDFRLDATLHEGGRLSAEGQADLAGPSVTADLDLTDITLLPLQAYIADFARVSLNSGRAGLKGRLEFASGNGGARFSGSARVDDLAVTETTGGATLVAWQALQASGLALAPGGLDIKEVALERPAGKFIINPDMTTNWQDTLISTPAKKAAPDRAATPQPDFQVQVGRVRIRDGALNFGDLSLKPQFRSDIHALNGSIAGISTASGARASADLKGRVDEFGSATIKGELQPGAPQEFTDILMAFQNIDLSHLTPYSAKFAGYKINSGKLSLDLGYKVQKAQLQGNNQIIVDKLTLGEKVESPDAINAPLELAIALLEDANGRIEIGLPVSGDLNEPQFSYGHLIWKALGNLITKAISAPFRALAGALGVADEGLDNIAFAPGDGKTGHGGEDARRTPQTGTRDPGHVLADRGRRSNPNPGTAPDTAAAAGRQAGTWRGPRSAEPDRQRYAASRGGIVRRALRCRRAGQREAVAEGEARGRAAGRPHGTAVSATARKRTPGADCSA